MKEHNEDRFWELATLKIHKEANANELSELSSYLTDKKYAKKYSEIAYLNEDIKATQQLSHVSQQSSWTYIKGNLQNKTMQLFRKVSGYAAVFVVALLLGGLVVQLWGERANVEQFAEVKVPLGQMSEITLYDGTHVWLNSGTTLKYSNSFGRGSRNVTLDGEAYFDVEKSDVPFRVRLKHSFVEVLGTQFNVISYQNDSNSEITLVEGSVNVNNLNGDNVAHLKPSQQLTIDDVSLKAKLKTVDTGFYVSWTEGKIVFHDEKLSEICERLERWYNVDITLEDKDVEELNFSGTILKDKPFSQIITAFELLLPVEIEFKHMPGAKDKVTITKK
ncbi:FecR domain-containing protein [uncultured Draconibacterium sp.]|uniref:FecR family protein n=1 Tax=uncultured Draconibacterium sp. TaxID=1573823 RepID=UPI0029C91240|nr:FecR domain-containing protein [uncultured Draconibacterium sp.]